MNLYPAIDLHQGRCVRLHQGQFDQATVYGEDPVAMAVSFRSSGASHLHIVDLDGSRDGATPHAELIKRMVQASGLVVQVGGGIRSVETAATYVAAGVSRLVVGSLAVRSPDAVLAMAKQFGPERLVLALDVRPRTDGTDYNLAIQGWTEEAAVTPWSVLESYLAAGLRHVLCTDISRDGVLSGPNLDLYQQMLDRYPSLQLLASGGVSSLADLQAIRRLPLAGAIVGKALYTGRFTLAEALQCFANA
jgi:phosphoribosylformimino-5-aminoimidazole carboxamide ribotide isomerase